MINERKQGALFVIDGTDGSGKATQTKMLAERFRSEGRDVETISFPRYGVPGYALVENYLAGKYGKDAKRVNAKAGSVLYAADRFDASVDIHQWLKDGKIVIIDRYAGSNMGHQGSKISDPDERKAFIEWNDELEHDIFGIPRPNVNVVLLVPPEISQKLAHQGASEKTKVKGDIHEADFEHLSATARTYREITEMFSNFIPIECVNGDVLRSREDIHEEVWRIVNEHL